MRITLLIVVLLFSGLASVRAADAVPPATYFPILPLDAPSDIAPQLVPVATNHTLTGSHIGITRAIIVVHDDNRDANASLGVLSALAGAENASTMVLAPQFMLPSDLVRMAEHLPDHGHFFATWQMDGWPAGDDSIVPPQNGQRGISSFTVVDLFLMYLTDYNAFPELKTIIIVGVGTGANFVQRYAAFNLASDAIDKQKIDLRYIVANASSYLYLTAARPLGGRKGFGIPDSTTCPAYNFYPYGVERLNPYTRRVGANAAKNNYALRFITYINAPSTDLAAESNCAVAVEGNTYAARALNFHLYLQSLYGDVGERTQTFFRVQDTKNDAMGLLGSSCGMEVLFGDGLCPHIEEKP